MTKLKVSAFLPSIAIAVFSVLPAYSDPIIAMTGFGLNLSQGGRDHAVTTTWYQSSTYSNVTISGFFDTFQGRTGTAFVYLTTSVGPGVGLPIATQTITVPPRPCHDSIPSCGNETVLFSGLTLGAGRYYVTLGFDPSTDDYVGWYTTAHETIFLAPGVVSPTTFASSNPNLTYAPASTFDFAAAYKLALNVSGTAIPEPSVLALFGLGGGVGLLLRKRLG